MERQSVAFPPPTLKIQGSNGPLLQSKRLCSSRQPRDGHLQLWKFLECLKTKWCCPRAVPSRVTAACLRTALALLVSGTIFFLPRRDEQRLSPSL